MDSFIGDVPEPKWPQHGPYSSSARADSVGSPDAKELPWIHSRGAFLLSILFMEKTVELEFMIEPRVILFVAPGFSRSFRTPRKFETRRKECTEGKPKKNLRLSATDIVAPATMKNAAKCET
ncbi:hypothetical protein R1flu_008810 [Riccia fluitans]|uniref:Uncharacterized protein n=1 Tax=Riccia fluitans TaxID=41844 RepID=A0ABD1Z143_9MARC